MKITMYELLGLVKDGKQPNHIKFKNDDWYWGYDTYIPYSFLDNTPDVQISTSLFHRYRIDYCLNDEVEILEEKKIPENNFNYIYSCEDEHIMTNFENIKTTLKDIIDYLKSKEKGE